METVVVWIKIGIAFLILTFLAILDIGRKDFGSFRNKAVWSMVALVPFFGWLIYLLFGFRKGTKVGKPDLTNQG